VLKHLADHIVLVSPDDGDDLHGAAAVGAEEWIGVVNVLDEDGPAVAGKGVCGWGRGDETFHGSSDPPHEDEACDSYGWLAIKKEPSE
jgi:hypothetical protein